jgi:hypothetical protein
MAGGQSPGVERGSGGPRCGVGVEARQVGGLHGLLAAHVFLSLRSTSMAVLYNVPRLNPGLPGIAELYL